MNWRQLLGAKAPSIPDLESSLAALRAEKAEAEAEVAALSTGRRAVLLDGSDDALKKHDDIAAAAARRRDRARVVSEEVAAKLDAARAAAAEAARRARYDAAAAQAEAARAELRRVYPEAVARLRALLRQLAEAEVAVAAGNADRPAGAAPLAGPEDFRLGTGRREEVLGTEEVELWADRRGIPNSVEAQPHVVEDGTGHGYLPQSYHGTGRGSTSGLRRIAFTATTFQPADDFPRVGRLAVTLALPPMLPGKAHGWEPLSAYHDAQPGRTPAPVLAALYRLDALNFTAPLGPKPAKVRHEVVNPRELYWKPTMARDAPAWAGGVDPGAAR